MPQLTQHFSNYYNRYLFEILDFEVWRICTLRNANNPYSIPMLRRPLWSSFVVVVVFRRQQFQISSPLKPLDKQSQILCGASLGRGNESLYKWSRSRDKGGRHAHIW